MGKLLRIYKLDNGRFSITRIGHQTNLVCDEKTRVIYYKFSEYADNMNVMRNSYFGPYISENGKHCRFIRDKIVEIE